MLTHIHIKDLAIVTSLELELEGGMTALTGETGAGKSILIDALGLALGDRADSTMIRSSTDRAEITVAFDLPTQSGTRKWLEEQALDAGDDCILRRILMRNGRSRAYINNTPVSVQSLQTLGEQLVDIHSQHAHQSLLRREAQRQLLDAYADHASLCAEVTRLYRAYRSESERLEKLRAASEDRTSRLDLLRYQVNELETLQLDAEGIAELHREHSRLANAEKLRESCDLILALLYDAENSVQETLGRATRELSDLSHLDDTLSENGTLLESALIQVQEGAADLRQYAEGVEVDPERLGNVERRLEEIHDLARKHRIPPEELPQQLAALQQELDELEHADIHLSKLESEVASLHESYLEQCAALSEGRRRAAKKLEKAVTETMQNLGMPGGRFSLHIDTLPEEQGGAHGMDRVEFRVTANPGQPPQPLIKVASGGELSRISLAIQVATVNCGRIPTLIFDEIDVGIGGAVAEIVGQLLRRLGGERQILCVTHLPQVAAQGHHHLQITKRTDGTTIYTHTQSLEADERVQEIARMLGGLEITNRTLAHAREMISLSGKN